MLGGLLNYHAPDLEVLLVGRGDHLDAMQAEGHVRLDGPWGSRRVPVSVSSDLGDIVESDYLLLTVKSQSTENVLRAAGRHLPGKIVIAIQNGINQRVLRRFVHPERLIMGMTATNMTIPEPGRVSLQRIGPTILGATIDGEADTQVSKAAQLLKTTGLPVSTSPDVIAVQYNKLAVNTLGCASALSASNFITEGILNRTWRRVVGRPLLCESLGVLRRVGIRVAHMPGSSDAHRLRRMMAALQIPLVDAAIKIAGRRPLRRRQIVFSLQQDLLRRKATEVDYINGEIVRLARQHDCDAPRNAKVVEMVHELERRADGTFFSPEEVISAFQGLQSI